MHQRLLVLAAERYWAAARPGLDPESDGRKSRCCLNDLVEQALDERWQELGQPDLAGSKWGESVGEHTSFPRKRTPRRKLRSPRVKFTTTISKSHKVMLHGISSARHESLVQVLEEAIDALIRRESGSQRTGFGILLSELIPLPVGLTDSARFLRHISSQ